MAKKNIVGVSVSPELGLEVAQIDFVSRTVLKYGCKPLVYDNARREIADMDLFKDTLQDLFAELDIPKGSEVAITLPAITFRVVDYPASLDSTQITNAIEEDLVNHPIFQNNEPCISATKLPNSTIQFNKIAYTASQKTMLIEIAMQIKELGYRLTNIDTSVNATLNSLIYNERVNVAPDASWVLVLVENNCCRIIPMQGRNYVDCFEERISIGEVLGDAENYATVVNAVNPIIKNLPSMCLYVVSKTNVISAEVLASKLIYNAQIVHQEANNFAKAPFLEIGPLVDETIANSISLDVIGAAINEPFKQYSNAHINLFNSSLGDVYILEQPPVVKIGEREFVLSMENMVKLAILFALIILVPVVGITLYVNKTTTDKKAELSALNTKISDIDKFLADNKNVSSELFDEGDEIRMGLIHNKNIYTYYTIVGTEIPKKLWLTGLKLGKNTTIEGQADNLESVYSFFRNIKDYNPDSQIKLQKLALASNSNIAALTESGNFDTDSIITSMNADFYEFRISDAPEVAATKDDNKNKTKKSDSAKDVLDLEILE